MSLDAVLKVELELDASEPDPEIARLMLLRSLAAEYQHRRLGGRSPETALDDIQNLRTAIKGYGQLRLRDLDRPTLCALHGSLSGRTDASAVRETPIGVIPNAPGAKVLFTGAPAAEVASRVDETVTSLFGNASLSRFERIALGYFELIRTHPFEDGNGRLSRLLMAILLRNEFRFQMLLDVTHVMRTNFRLYHRLIRSEEVTVYEAWLRYASGIVTAEIHAAKRFRTVVDTLTSVERVELNSVVGDMMSQNCRGGEVPRSVTQRVAALLVGLLH
jgi:prophage maintenance system killer protein